MFIKPVSLSATYRFVSRILHLVASRKISKECLLTGNAEGILDTAVEEVGGAVRRCSTSHEDVHQC